MSTKVATPRKVASTATSGAALAKGRHTPVNATSAPITMTLPTGAAEGVFISVEKIDATDHAVTITGHMRGSSGQSVVLHSQYDGIDFVANSAGSWWPIGSIGATDAEITALAAAADDSAALRQAFGSIGGQPISPWEPAPTIGPELWTLANMQGGYNTTELAPSITADGSSHNKRTRINLGNIANVDTTYRLELDFDQSTIPSGWMGVTVGLTNSGASELDGTDFQTIVSDSSPQQAGHYILDFKPVVGVTGSTYLEVRLDVANNAPSGTIGISNVSLKQTGDVTRPMLVSKQYSTGSFPYSYWQARDAKTGTWKVARIEWSDDGDLTPVAYKHLESFNTDDAWLNGPVDPAFVRTAGGYALYEANSQQETGTTVSLRIGNNDQILEVWNGSDWELRGNTHGGEFARGAGATYKVDRGNGLVAWSLAHGLDPVWRFQVNLPTELRRSTDDTTPFAEVDHLFTCYRDGVIRCDRTTTFLADTDLRNVFEWMSSHNTDTPYIGRIGKGLDAFAEVDTHPKVATPGTVTPSTSGSGGTLLAGTYSYRVSALSRYGETLATEAVEQVTTGSTSTVTLDWSDVTNAVGYNIYGRSNAGRERFLTRVATSTFTDTGSLVPSTEAPKLINTARLVNGTTAPDSAHSTDASWAVWKEPTYGWCYGNIYDRESVNARSQVDKTRTRLERGDGIQKNYANIYWADEAESVTIPEGTIWTATHYSYVYLPFDPDQYHHEIAVRAANLAALGDLYPTT